MMTKRIVASVVLGLVVATAAQGQSFWSGRFSYDHAGNSYAPREFSLDLLGSYATRSKGGASTDAWGLGAGLNYFFTPYFGVGVDTYAQAFEIPYLLNGS